MVSAIENHRERETGVLVYPVYSRRSGGLSVGINLFPGKKHCSFNCPYCEVFPFTTNASFSLHQLETDLQAAVSFAQKQEMQIKDICFSGNGEPTLSPDFPEALELAGSICQLIGHCPPSLVLITCGAGLLDQKTFSLLEKAAAAGKAAGSPALDIWLKLDAGTPEWYEKINRSKIPHETLLNKIKTFTALAPITIQTMLCAVDGKEPPPEEAAAWESLIVELAEKGRGNVRKIHIYGKARPAPEDPKTQAVPVSCLEKRAAALREAFNRSLSPACASPPVEVFC